MTRQDNGAAQTEIGRYAGLMEFREGKKVALKALFTGAGRPHAHIVLDEIALAWKLVNGRHRHDDVVQLREGLTALWLRADVMGEKAWRHIRPQSAIFDRVISAAGVGLNKVRHQAADYRPAFHRELSSTGQAVAMRRFDASPV